MAFKPGIIASRGVAALVQKEVRKFDKTTNKAAEEFWLGDVTGNLNPIIENDAGDLHRDFSLWLVRRDKYGPPEKPLPWLGRSAFPTEPHIMVWVGYDYDGKTRGILGPSTGAMLAQNINPNVYNTLDTRAHGYVDTERLPTMLSRAIGSAATPSTKILVSEELSWDENNQATNFRGGLIDTASSIDADGQRLFHIWRLPDLTLTATTSTPKSAALEVTIADFQETLDSRPARAKSAGVWLLPPGATSITDADKWWDTRQFLNDAPPRHNWFASTDPDVTDDEDSGYDIGSFWCNNTTPEAFVCVDASAGAAVWQSLSGSGSSLPFSDVAPLIANDADPTKLAQFDLSGLTAATTRTYALPDDDGTIALLSDIPAGTMSSFTVSGDSGTPQTISDGNTLNIAGGAGIDSVASATDVLTLAVDSTVIRTSGTQSIGAGLTVDTPTVANLTNMQHDHLDADDGGTLDAAAVASGIFPAARIPGLPYKTALPTLRRVDNATLYINPGVVDVNGTRVEYTTTRVLGMATNADWIGGTSLEAASTYANVYSDAAGNRLLYDALPNCPSPVAPVFTGQINGSPGLNGTSIVYDGDTGEGNLAVGQLLGVYTNSTLTTGRGRGAAAAGHLNFASFALITAINTGTNTITVEAGHNINLTDNDYLIAVPFGPLIYRDVSGTWYRFLGSMYNNASSNLDDDRLDNRALHVLASSYSTTSTTVVDVDSTNLLFSVLSTGTDISVTFTGTCAFSAGATGGVQFDFFIDGVAYSGGTGVQKVLTQANTGQAFGWIEILKNLLPGTHTILAKFWSGAAGTSYILANSTLAGTVYTTKNQFIVERAN